MRDIFADSSDEETATTLDTVDGNGQLILQTASTSRDDTKHFNKKLKLSLISSQSQHQSSVAPPIVCEQNTTTNNDGDCDDSEGYYKIRLGEILDNRYCVYAFTGQGVFSNVVRARFTNAAGRFKAQQQIKSCGVLEIGRYDLQRTGKIANNDNNNKKVVGDVAIKILRNNEAMRKTGLRELQMLERLNESDPDDKHHCLRLYNNFYHRNHLCLVFESLCMNLREVLKKNCKNLGPSRLDVTRSFGKQLFLALDLLKRCKILHADIKPDNILVDETFKKLKLCDFGSASKADENEIAPYLVSRYYRAPEIILGLEYDYALDLWSVACTLFEVFTGKILFEGKTNNHMLKLIMDLKGKFPRKMIKRGKLSANHFGEDLNFLYKESSEDEAKEATIVVVKSVLPNRDLKRELTSVIPNLGEADYRDINLFMSLLDRIFTLDPAKRPPVEHILSHQFIEPRQQTN